MLALLARRLGRDRRWRLRLAVTPDRGVAAQAAVAARRRDRPQGSGDLGIRMRRALAPARRVRRC